MPDLSARPGLRIAAICPPMADWDNALRQVMDRLAGDDRFDLVALITHPAPARPSGRLLSMILQLEARCVVRFAPWPMPAFDAGQTALARLTDDAAGRAALPDCDVILNLTDGPVPGAWADLAPMGLWSLSSFAPLAGVAEAMRKAPWTTAEIRVQGADGASPSVIATARYDTKFLAARNRAFLRQKAVQLLEHALACVALGQDMAAAPSDPAPAPSPADLPGYVIRVGAEVARRLWDKLRTRLGGRPGRFALRIIPGTPLDFRLPDGVTHEAPKGQYWADPFVFQKDGATQVFFEVFDYASGKGHLAVADYTDAGFQVLGRTHAEPHHMSYPFVFREGDDVFMLPECCAAGHVQLWRATSYPRHWEEARTVLDDMCCSDTTLVDHDGTRWMFTNICRDDFEDYCSELHLFRVEGPGMRRLVAHPQNPVGVGSDRARGAGRLFTQDGRLYRPSQDNTHHSYGYGLNIMAVETLTATAYAETRVRHITPEDDPTLIGCHHIDVLDGSVIVDVRYR